MNGNWMRLIEEVRAGRMVIVTGPVEARKIRAEAGEIEIHVEPLMPQGQVLAMDAKDYEGWKEQMKEAARDVSVSTGGLEI